MTSPPTLTSSPVMTLTSSQWSEIASQCLRRHHRELVHGVDPQHIVDYLFEVGLLSVDDLELTQNLPTKSGRMRHLLIALHGRLVASNPEVVLRHFLLSLSREYDFLETRLREVLDGLIQDEIDSNRRNNRTTDNTEDNKQQQQQPICLEMETTENQETTVLMEYNTTPPSESTCKHIHSNTPSSECASQIGFNNGNYCVEVLIKTITTPSGESSTNRNLDSNRQSAWGVLTTTGPLLMPPSNRGKRFKSIFHRKIFDFLSNSVNDQHFDHYTRAKTGLKDHANRDPDTKYLILYLDACKCAIKSDFVASKRAIVDSLRMASVASAPNRFHALSLSVRVWINLKRWKLDKADRALTAALHIVTQDPVTCSGMTAGWLYVDEAKLLMARMTSAMRHADVMRRRAVEAMEKAMEQFRLDESADGPYGVNFAAVKLASLLLACDDRLTLVDLVDPTTDEVKRADALLLSVDDSRAGIPSILKPLFLVAQADRKFRSSGFRRAVELANDAKDLASRTGLNEEEVLADFRIKCYTERTKRDGCLTLNLTLTSPDVTPSWSSDEADVDESDIDDDVITGSRKRTKRKLKKKKRRRNNAAMMTYSSSQELCKRTRVVFGFRCPISGLFGLVVVCLIVFWILIFEVCCLNINPSLDSVGGGAGVAHEDRIKTR